MAVTLEALAPADAIAAFQARKPNLVDTFSWQDAWQEEHATMFTVAKSAGFDVLNDIQAALEEALKNGSTVRDFSKQLKPVLQAKGWWGKQLVTDPATGERVPGQLGSARRLQTIFDTNMRVSYAAGHWASFQRTKKARPYLRYVAILDERTRPAHRARHNLVLPVDDPYWDHWAPPCGWNCRCTLQSLSQNDIDRLIREGEQLMFVAPQDTYRSFTNRRTGEITRVPDGIDPGWAYNPGKAGYEAKVNSALSEKIAAASPQFVAAAVDERVASTAFDRFIDDPQGTMPVMTVPDEISSAAHSDVRVALLSAETMAKQKRHHPELTIEDYRAIPSIGIDPTLIIQDGQNTFVLVKLSQDRWRYVAMKFTATGKAAFVTSYRYASDANVARLVSREGTKVLVDRRGD